MKVKVKTVEHAPSGQWGEIWGAKIVYSDSSDVDPLGPWWGMRVVADSGSALDKVNAKRMVLHFTDVLERLEAANVPIPIKMWFAAAGVHDFEAFCKELRNET